MKRWSHIAMAIGSTVFLAVCLLLTAADTRAKSVVPVPKHHAVGFEYVRLPGNIHAWYECCQDQLDTYNTWAALCREFPDSNFACLFAQVALAELMYCETCHPWPLCGSWGWCGEG